MKQKTYSKRAWLNKKGSPSTGSAAAYHGQMPWGKKGQKYTYFEVSDCHNSIRLHQTEIEPTADFIRKLRKLAKMATDFADFMEQKDHG